MTQFGLQRAIKSYKSQLATSLRRRYGLAPYTETQIADAVDYEHLNPRFVKYACLMYAGKNYAEENFSPQILKNMQFTIQIALS